MWRHTFNKYYLITAYLQTNVIINVIICQYNYQIFYDIIIKYALKNKYKIVNIIPFTYVYFM